MNRADKEASLIIIAIVAGILIPIIVVTMIMLPAHKEEMYDQMEMELKESRERQAEWNSRFLILDDCTEMILQLTEKRFYNDTYKQEAWNHYRGLC